MEENINVPRAFRIKPLKTTIFEESTCSSSDGEEEKMIDVHRQISRRLRWEIFRQTLEGSFEWNDERERQFVFNLLEFS
uniref:Uncharacterized protein n=1 Tax=Panagrolaimus superbus TaxID=310955 RepID=A0A914YGS0_9BILA